MQSASDLTRSCYWTRSFFFEVVYAMTCGSGSHGRSFGETRLGAWTWMPCYRVEYSAFWGLDYGFDHVFLAVPGGVGTVDRYFALLDCMVLVGRRWVWVR